MFYVEADKNKAWCTHRELLTTGSKGVQVELSFSDDWDGLTKFAIFRAYDVSYADVVESDTITIPDSVLVKANVNLMIGLYGVNSDGTVAIPTVYADLGAIHKGAEIYDASNATLPPDANAFYTKLAELVSTAVYIVDHSSYSASLAFSIGTSGATEGHLIETITVNGTSTDYDLGKVVGDSVSQQDLEDAIEEATTAATASATESAEAAATSAASAATAATSAATSASSAASSASSASSAAATKQAQHKTASATLAANNTTWSNVSVTGVTASNTVIVTPDPSTFEAWVNAGVYCYSQGSGTLTFKALAAPSVAVKANILILD